MHKIINGNCLEVMKTFPDNHFNCVVTDPPYGLQFMSKVWDQKVPGKEYWEELLRICKPGTTALVFGGTRTYHRLACALEDAGWEIRDSLMWIYGSGFPKSHNKFGLPGYGTALKPAYEPILLAMKPLDGTFANNAETWGVGGINIDGCRIKSMEKWEESGQLIGGRSLGRYEDGLNNSGRSKSNDLGRWPANLILDEESAEELDEMTKDKIHSAGSKRNKIVNSNYNASSFDMSSERQMNRFGDSGGASRFFYCAKASSKERNAGSEKNNHPTVKPLSLMKYLLTLLAPPGNPICLDPFSGSGSTLVAAKELGIECVGIELSDEYCEIANARIKHAKVPDPELF